MKVIIVTIFLTLMTVFVAFQYFMGAILGTFGLAATTVGQLQNLRQSQQVVEKLKTKNATKKKTAGKKFTRRVTRRAGASAAAAVVPVVGIAAVAAYVTGEEVRQHCDDLADIQDTENIINGTNIEFSFDDCTDQLKADAEVISKQAVVEAKRTLEELPEKSSEAGAQLWEIIRNAINEHFPGTLK